MGNAESTPAGGQAAGELRARVIAYLPYLGSEFQDAGRDDLWELLRNASDGDGRIPSSFDQILRVGRSLDLAIALVVTPLWNELRRIDGFSEALSDTRVQFTSAFGFLGHELRRSGRPDLDEVLESLENAPDHVIDELFPPILQAALDLGCPSAMIAGRLWAEWERSLGPMND